MLDMKDENEVAEEETKHQKDVEMGIAPSQGVVEEENMKTVIVNKEFEKDFQRYLINTDWKLNELADYLKIQLSIEPET